MSLAPELPWFACLRPRYAASVRVRVLYFAVVRERTRRTQEDLDLPAGTTAAGLLAEVGARHDAVRPLLAHLQIACNQELVAPGTVLSDGDEVALIPPVSGGAGDPPRFGAVRRGAGRIGVSSRGVGVSRREAGSRKATACADS